MTIAECRARREPDRRPPVADEQRRNRDLQTIEQVRLEKHRDRHAAAFHENPVAPSRAQQAKDLGDVEASRTVVDRHHRRTAKMRFRLAGVRASADIEGIG